MSKLGLDQWFPKCVESPTSGIFRRARERKTKGAEGGENAQPLIDRGVNFSSLLL